jgi:hypothetical protein
VIEETVQAAAGSSNDPMFSLAEYTLGVALLNRDGEADRQRGLELMVRARDVWRARVLRSSCRSPICGLPGTWLAWRARCCHCRDA